MTRSVHSFFHNTILRFHIRALFALSAAALLFAFSFSHASAAATLYLSPASGSYNVGATLSVKVMVDGGGDAVNAVETELSFDKALLSVTNISKTGSAFSLWTTEPTFSNAQGTINFGGGSPTPFSAKSQLVTITFKALKEGSAAVSFASGSVLAADGLGTDILGAKTPATYTISAAAAPPPAPAPKGDLPGAPEISSETHPDPEGWYGTTTAQFSWSVPADVTSVRLLIGSKPIVTPTVVYTPPISEKILTDLDEGTSYFHVQFKNSEGWGEITHRKILTDLTPPASFEVTVGGEATTSQPVLFFEAFDELSGMKEYRIAAGDRDPLVLPAAELSEEGYTLSSLPKGTYTVIVRAVDLAGNTTDAPGVGIVIEKETAPAPKIAAPLEEGPSFWEQYKQLIIVLILLLIIIILIGVIIYQRRLFMMEKLRGKREAKEIRTKMEKVFSALRDEVEEQVNALDKKPRLTQLEKKMLDELREALDISEELINKEIEDVEKALK